MTDKGISVDSITNKRMEKFTGGLKWGNSFWNDKGDYGNATFPFATLELRKEMCILTRTIFGVTSISYVLPIKDIKYVTIKSFLFFKGILFVHDNCNIPKYLLFWTIHPRRICNKLNSLGICVK